MQIKEVTSDGLKRELEVVVATGELNERFQSRLNQLKDTVQLKGFRKGKVPVNHLRKVYGKSVMLEVLNDAVNESSAKAIEEREERPAVQPDIKLPEDEAKIERILAGEDDLAYSMSFEVLPKIELVDFSTLKLEKFVVEVEDADRDEAIDKLLDSNLAYDVEEGRVAEDGDQLTIDFVGRIDGEAFEGGSAEGIDIVLGKGQFIPGFEEQLVGAKAGDEKLVEVNFPDDYGAEHLRGKAAAFETNVKAVAKSRRPDANDAFAQSLGLENLDKLKEHFTQRISEEYGQAARAKLKRELLDALEEAHKFELPPTLVEREFDSMWNQVTSSMKNENKTWDDQDKTEEETRKDYREISERRVRLGLVIGEIGDKNKIEVGEDELRKALMEQVRQFPGQEKMVYEYYQKNPSAVAELRAPLFEEKVVDFILELAKPDERKVTKEELQAALNAMSDDDDEAEADSAEK
ncbi:MAG: trigger factor [Alphaproteobacteria bacterium]|nr:trigger factor [Alphaproteobacteria bacterium]